MLVKNAFVISAFILMTAEIAQCGWPPRFFGTQKTCDAVTKSNECRQMLDPQVLGKKNYSVCQQQLGVLVKDLKQTGDLKRSECMIETKMQGYGERYQCVVYCTLLQNYIYILKRELDKK